MRNPRPMHKTLFQHHHVRVTQTSGGHHLHDFGLLNAEPSSTQALDAQSTRPKPSAVQASVEVFRHLWFIDAQGETQLQGSCQTHPLAKRSTPVLNYIAHMLQGVPDSAIGGNSSASLKAPLHSWILGLGCGSVAHGLWAKCPNITMALVDIDPIVIDVAQRYFDCPSDNAQWRYHCSSIQDWLAKQLLMQQTQQPPPLQLTTPMQGQHSTDSVFVAPAFIALDAYCIDVKGPSVGTDNTYAILAQLLSEEGCLAVNLHEQHGFAAHLKALEIAFESRVKVHFVAGQGNPIAYAYGKLAYG